MHRYYGLLLIAALSVWAAIAGAQSLNMGMGLGEGGKIGHSGFVPPVLADCLLIDGTTTDCLLISGTSTNALLVQ